MSEGRRRFVKTGVAAVVGLASGALFTTWYERLSPYGLAEEFRREYTAALSRLSDVQAKLNEANDTIVSLEKTASKITTAQGNGQTEAEEKLLLDTQNKLKQTERTLFDTKDKLDNVQTKFNLANQTLDNLSKLEADSASAISGYEQDALTALAGLQGVINKYSPILDSKWTQAEQKTLEVLETDQRIQSDLRGKISSLQSQLNGLTGNYRELESQHKDLLSHPVVSWESNFRDGTLDGFNPATTDETPGLDCPEYPHNQSDVLSHVVDDDTTPSGYGKALELVANVSAKPAVYVNAITARFSDFIDDSIWRVYGYFKKVDSKLEILGVNLSRSDGGLERPAIFGWVLNRFSPYYGWFTLGVPGTDGKPVLKKFST